MTEKLFSPIKIGSLELPNRFMRSSCYMHGCDNNGFPHPWLIKYYKDMADGKMGLIIPGYMYLNKNGKALPNQACFYTDRHAKAWKSTVDYVHKKGSKIIFQIGDGGTYTTHDVIQEDPRGASPQQEGQREITKMEISQVIEDFAQAAVRLQSIGVDGMQIHAAHGYLISGFLNPATNKRTDEYGGSPENRRRILQEIVSAIRSAVGNDFFVSAKVNVDDCMEGGGKPQDLAETVKAIKGIDLYEISSGFQNYMLSTRPRTLSQKKFDYGFSYGYNIEGLKVVRQANPNSHLAVCGALRTIDDMNLALDSGADLVSFGRPSIADPKMVKHLMEGEKQVRCMFCSVCLKKAFQGRVRCSVYK